MSEVRVIKSDVGTGALRTADRGAYVFEVQLLFRS